SAVAAPVTVDFTGFVDQFNPGPFTRNVALQGQITLDDTVIPSGPNNTFENVITGFSLTISEIGGDITYTNNGTGGRVEQFSSADGTTEFVEIAFGGGAPGTFVSPVGAPQMTSFGIDFRGADLFADPTALATGLTEADFGFSFMTSRFDFGGLNQLMVDRSLDTVTFSGERQTVSVHAPGATALFVLGFAGLWVRRRWL
ncbi:unnamed protein product, partial [Laminaria digitata]